MFAKFSPQGNRVAYVRENNIYVENLEDDKIIQLTQDGTDRIINGTLIGLMKKNFIVGMVLDGVQMAATSLLALMRRQFEIFTSSIIRILFIRKLSQWNILKREKSHQKLK